MNHMFSREKPHALILILVLWLSSCWLYGTSNAIETDVDSVIRGTLIIALKNENGFVLMTDSMQTRVYPDGKLEPWPNAPAQKLFELGERSVCMIAGFGSTAFPTDPQFNMSAAGIIGEYQKELTRKSRSPSVSESLWSLSFLFRSYLGGTATLKQFIHTPQKIDTYSFALIVAGYDPDGLPKLGVLRLTPDSSSRTIVDFDASIREVKLGKGLDFAIEGQPAKALDIMNNPQKYAGDPIIRSFAEAWERDKANSLRIEEMKQLAEALMRHTEKENFAVGGERQIATIVKGESPYIEQRQFPPQPLPIRPFTIVSSSFFQGGGFFLGENTGLFIGNRFENTKPLVLDGNFFFGNVFRNSQLRYDGGMTHFDQTNNVGDSILVFGKHANQKSPFGKKLKEGFSWGSVVVEPR